MKHTFKISAITLLLVLIGFTSCKYEEGPAISVRSKKERMANTWKVVKAMDNGEDVTSHYDQYELQMLVDGDASIAAIYTSGNFSFEYESNGTWTFANNKEELMLDFEDDAADNTYQILKLEEKELWLREKGEDTELHLEPK